MFPFNVAFWVLPALVPGEAEQLLREMDARIIAAQSVRVEFAISSRDNGRLMEGSLLLASGNRFREELKPINGPKAFAVSDGKRVFSQPEAGRPDAAFPGTTPPEWYNEAVKSWLGRGGTFLTLTAASEQIAKRHGDKPTSTGAPRATNAKFLPDEFVNGVKTRVVAYDLFWTAQQTDLQRAKVQVWIDAQTKLPLRRNVTFSFKPSGDIFTAIHTKFELDPKLDDKLFEIPK